ncbi:SEL1-like repeat protein [Gilliamella sp. Pas-s25]|uniref:SEL1-like repeat protein n=1 Tax=Gilliamella sp. Pas-s25 TaxID=2687310 RepID=UPI00135EF6E1|nr:SEL1-like repeat protein [Gilliamella sp. Pas-s25]MWP62967.1 hypothetical protein [Gilliamella sp. Pas-s25]
MSKYINYIFDHFRSEELEIKINALRTIIQMFSYYVKKSKIDGKGISIISVNFSNKELVEDYDEFVDIESKIDPNDIDKLTKLGEVKAKEYYLLKVYNILLPFLIEKGIDLAKFEQVIALIREKNFIFEEQWKSKWNPTRQTQVTVRWLYTDKIYFYLDIFHKNSQLKETIHFITVGPALSFLELCLGPLKWKDNNTVLLYQKNSRDYWEINIITKEVDFIYEPAIKDYPYKQYAQYNLALRFLEGLYGVPKNLEKAKYWLNKSAAQGLPKAIKLLEKLNHAK